MTDHLTDCTPGHCSYGYGHACNQVTRYPETFPPGGAWRFAWREGTRTPAERRDR